MYQNRLLQERAVQELEVRATGGDTQEKESLKRRMKKHRESILQARDGCCFLCKRSGNYRIHEQLHRHHVYGGVANRSISEAEGFIVYLCPNHHNMSKEGVHHNAKNMLIVRQAMQRKFEENHTRKEFMLLIGKNYLDE